MRDYYMGKLESIYPLAVEHTKNKVMQDVGRYLEDKEIMPSFEQYLRERQEYISQIWINVWLNKVTNDIPRDEKKLFLNERGFETKDVNRKLINQLFRTEMREYNPFN